MFGRATIRLGIGPHSSYSCYEGSSCLEPQSGQMAGIVEIRAESGWRGARGLLYRALVACVYIFYYGHVVVVTRRIARCVVLLTRRQ